MRAFATTLAMSFAVFVHALPQQQPVSPNGLCNNENMFCGPGEYCAETYCRQLCSKNAANPCPADQLCASIGFNGHSDDTKGCYTKEECCASGAIDGLFAPGIGACTWPIQIDIDRVTGVKAYAPAPWPCNSLTSQWA